MTIEGIIDSFLKHGMVNIFDERGYYISEESMNGSKYYMYTDGIIRDGVCSTDSSAFWDNETDARTFLATWQKEQIKKDNKNGN